MPSPRALRHTADILFAEHDTLLPPVDGIVKALRFCPARGEIRLS